MKSVSLLVLAIAMSGCHTAPPVSPPTVTTDRVQLDEGTPPPASVEVPSPEPAPLQNEAPPCLPAPAEPKPVPKRHAPAAAVRKPSPARPEAAPPVASAGGAPTAQPIASISMSILGKKVRGAKGEDLGRLVDILADDRGRVRVAIIESGGFLGVGNRRVAVDWSLLNFHPDPNDSYVMLEANAQTLQETPEYKDSHQPVAIMAPNDSAPPTKP
jgi:PRC-barrel domain